MARIIPLTLADGTSQHVRTPVVGTAPAGGVDHERLLQAVMEHSQTGLLTLALGRSGPRVITANRCASALLDLDDLDVGGRGWADMLRPEDRLRLGRGVGQVLSGAAPTWRGEVRLLGASRRVISVVLSPVPRVDGQEDLVLAQLTDRTPEHSASERVADAQAVLTELGNAGGALTMVVDDKGVVLRFSDAGERVSGFAAEEVVGRPFWRSLVDPAEHAATAALFGEVDDRGRLAAPPVGVGQWRTRAGTVRQVLWVRTPMAWVLGAHICSRPSTSPSNGSPRGCSRRCRGPRAGRRWWARTRPGRSPTSTRRPSG
jgi:PAS domain S-box-containing protein